MACHKCEASTLLLIVLTFCTYLTSAGHIHRHGIHRHVHREDASAPTSTSHRRLSSYNSTNLAVYYGITPATTATGLLTLCAHPSVNIINIAFLTTFFGPNGYPTISFGPGCTGPNPIQSATAPGLSSCPVLAAQILACQMTYKTKILISLGGWNAASSFSSSQQAAQFAHTLWNLFGGGKPSPQDVLLRPFGPTVKIDGFDIDNESHNPAHYTEFVIALRKLYAQDKSKRYYISAAPQCPRPEESIPLAAMRMVDFVHVQFYNNPGCNLGTEGFWESVTAWSQDLAVAGNSRSSRVWAEGNGFGSRGPLMFIGAPAWAGGAGSGYVGPSVFEGLMRRVKGLGLPNLGGVMLWDGSEGVGNVGGDGRTFVDVAGRALA